MQHGVVFVDSATFNKRHHPLVEYLTYVPMALLTAAIGGLTFAFVGLLVSPTHERWQIGAALGVGLGLAAGIRHLIAFSPAFRRGPLAKLRLRWLLLIASMFAQIFRVILNVVLLIPLLIYMAAAFVFLMALYVVTRPIWLVVRIVRKQPLSWRAFYSPFARTYQDWREGRINGPESNSDNIDDDSSPSRLTIIISRFLPLIFKVMIGLLVGHLVAYVGVLIVGVSISPPLHLLVLACFGFAAGRLYDDVITAIFSRYLPGLIVDYHHLILSDLTAGLVSGLLLLSNPLPSGGFSGILAPRVISFAAVLVLGSIPYTRHYIVEAVFGVVLLAIGSALVVLESQILHLIGIS
ncbi:MAG: hypothetical protein OJF49_003375 [Ktedonobacterales bacterium]|nr:MAG: hypothetical protein OJF49_003375 [Ktedonobacterales bacterium]